MLLGGGFKEKEVPCRRCWEVKEVWLQAVCSALLDEGCFGFSEISC